MKMRDALVPVVAAGLFLTGCAGSEPAPTDPQADYDLLSDNSHTEFVYEGESAILKPETDNTKVEQLTDQFPRRERNPLLFDLELHDIGVNAQRYVPKVSLGGDSPSLKNDLACDSLKIRQDKWDGKPYIAALAVGSGSEQLAIVNWPQGSDYVHICIPKSSKHPSSGVILASPHVGR